MPDAEPFDPFNAEPDPEVQKEALLRSLDMAQGFALYFVVCDPGSVRERLIQEIAAHFPEKEIQPIPVTMETGNLFHLLQTQLHDPPPGAVFVYGLENWISGAVDPRSIPFILNLNAARNNFYDLVHCPLVFFVARHVLQAIVNGAPDFFSVRSGLYVFPMSVSERKARKAQSLKIGQTEVLGLAPTVGNEHTAELEHLLAELRLLDNEQRDQEDLVTILSRLGLTYLSTGKYDEAEPLLVEALEIRRQSFEEKPLDLTISLINLAGFFSHKGNYDHSEELLAEALPLLRQKAGPDSLSTASCLHNLAAVRDLQGRYAESEALYLETLKIRRSALPVPYPELARSVNNLAELYLSQGRSSEAEPLLLESLQMRRNYLPSNHPNMAQSLNNLAVLYEGQGRFAEAGPLYFEAVKILCAGLGEQHEKTKTATENLRNFLAAKQEVTVKISIKRSNIMPITSATAASASPFKFKPMQTPRRKR